MVDNDDALPLSCVFLFWGLTVLAAFHSEAAASTIMIRGAARPTTTTTITNTTVAMTTSPCLFLHDHDGVHADCSRRNLTSLPRTWPGQVVWLDLSGNDVGTVDQGDLDQPELRGLRHLDLSDNKLKGRLGSGTFVDVPQLKVSSFVVQLPDLFIFHAIRISRSV